jgi:hypothetical protein
MEDDTNELNEEDDGSIRTLIGRQDSLCPPACLPWAQYANWRSTCLQRGHIGESECGMEDDMETWIKAMTAGSENLTWESKRSVLSGLPPEGSACDLAIYPFTKRICLEIDVR